MNGLQVGILVEVNEVGLCGLLQSDDTQVMMRALAMVGAKLSWEGRDLIVEGTAGSPRLKDSRGAAAAATTASAASTVAKAATSAASATTTSSASPRTSRSSCRRVGAI